MFLKSFSHSSCQDRQKVYLCFTDIVHLIIQILDKTEAIAYTSYDISIDSLVNITVCGHISHASISHHTAYYRSISDNTGIDRTPDRHI